MLSIYLKLAARSISRNKLFSLVNIIGLAVGLATCMLMVMYIFDEQRVDQHHTEGDRLFRVASETNKGGNWAAGPAPLAEGLKKDFPEVQASARLLTFPDIATMMLSYGEGINQTKLFENNGYYVDASFFELFTYAFIEGHALTALEKPNTMVLSRELASRLFGKEKALGKVVRISTPFGPFEYTVTGVFDSRNYPSHIPATFLLSMKNTDMWNWVQQQNSWVTNNIFFTYIKLKQGADPEKLQKKLTPFFEQYAGEGMKAAGFSKSLFLQPVEKIYLHSQLGNEIGANGNFRFLYVLGSIAAFILIIACINFMNLSTARSEKRAREVGVRKVIGARRSWLIIQFLGESVLMSVLALLLGVFMVYFLLPVFNDITGKQLGLWEHPELVGFIVLLTIVTGLLSGLYPAFYLSSFNSIAVLKGKIRNNFSALLLRKGLVVFQFVISVCLIVGALVTWKQMDLLKSQSLGFAKEQQLVFPMQQSYKSDKQYVDLLANELEQLKEVASVTSGSTYPGIPNLNSMLFYSEGQSSAEKIDVSLAAIEQGYFETLGMTVLGGRSFTENRLADSASIVLNEAAVRAFGYDVHTAVGKKIQYEFGGSFQQLEIIGIVKDFNFESLHHAIRPLGLTRSIFGNPYSFAIARVQTKEIAALLSSVESIWKRLFPDAPFTYSFLDQDFQRNYEKEQRTAHIVVYFTVIAILIACLGLFGLAAFSAEQRTKEIGIRKVIGASAFQVTRLLTREFLELVVVALVLALPLAAFLMNRWLQAFAYRTELSWWMFVLTGLLALGIALVTISFQALKAAWSNPVDSLRAE
jgi:putative ABC transport system permease protein